VLPGDRDQTLQPFFDLHESCVRPRSYPDGKSLIGAALMREEVADAPEVLQVLAVLAPVRVEGRVITNKLAHWRGVISRPLKLLFQQPLDVTEDVKKLFFGG